MSASTVGIVDEWDEEVSFCGIGGAGAFCGEGAFCVGGDAGAGGGSDGVVDGGGLCGHWMIGEVFVHDLLPCGWVVCSHCFECVF